MPDRYDLKNILEKGFEVANAVQFANGAPPVDEVSFVMGFINCFGILTGGVDIGLPQDAPLDQIFDAIHEDIVKLGRRIAENQLQQNRLRDFVNDN